MSKLPAEQTTPFRLEEATIDELHRAIRDGRTTCVKVVEQYIARARAYNGPSSLLVTADGADIGKAAGTVRAQSALQFPTKTVKASTLLPILTTMQDRRLNSVACRPPPPILGCGRDI